MDLNGWFLVYTIFWAMLGWPVVRALRRVLSPLPLLGLGLLLLALNLVIFLVLGNPFTIDSTVDPAVRFLLYPALVVGLLSCYDGLRRRHGEA